MIWRLLVWLFLKRKTQSSFRNRKLQKWQSDKTRFCQRQWSGVRKKPRHLTASVRSCKVCRWLHCQTPTHFSSGTALRAVCFKKVTSGKVGFSFLWRKFVMASKRLISVRKSCRAKLCVCVGVICMLFHGDVFLMNPMKRDKGRRILHTAKTYAELVINVAVDAMNPVPSFMTNFTE